MKSIVKLSMLSLSITAGILSFTRLEAKTNDNVVRTTITQTIINDDKAVLEEFNRGEARKREAAIHEKAARTGNYPLPEIQYTNLPIDRMATAAIRAFLEINFKKMKEAKIMKDKKYNNNMVWYEGVINMLSISNQELINMLYKAQKNDPDNPYLSMNDIEYFYGAINEVNEKHIPNIYIYI